MCCESRTKKEREKGWKKRSDTHLVDQSDSYLRRQVVRLVLEISGGSVSGSQGWRRIILSRLYHSGIDIWLHAADYGDCDRSKDETEPAHGIYEAS